MSLLRKTFRLWWQKPRAVADVPEERTVSFLELFYDLAYVAIIIQLTHVLAGHLDMQTFLEYVGLYAMVWFAWVNGSLYHELHGNNDIRTRVVTFLQLFALIWIGIFVPDAFSVSGYQGFALAYAGFLAVVGVMWWRTGVHDKAHRGLSRPYATAFLGATVAFLYSATTTMELAHQIWLAAIVFMLIVPFVFSRWTRNIDQAHVEMAQRIRPSLVERFGLLTIIVLGENIISIVAGATYLPSITVQAFLTVSCAVMIVFSLWWVYFDLISNRLPHQNNTNRLAWVYLHLPLTMSIGLVAVGLLNIIEYVTEPVAIDRWFVVAPAAAFLVVVVALLGTLQIKYAENTTLYRQAALVALLAAAGLLILGFSTTSLLVTLWGTWLLLTLPVFFGFLVWVKRSYQATEGA